MANLFPKRIGDKADSRAFDRVSGARKQAVLHRLMRYLAAYRWRILAAVALTFTANGFALLGPRLSGAAIDRIAGQGTVDFPRVFTLCAWMLGCYVLHGALSYLLSLLMAALGRDVTHRLRGEVFEKLHALPVRYFDRHQTGDIISHLSYDIDTIGESLSNDVLQIATSVITVLGSFVMMLTISPVLVLVFVITIPANLFFSRYRTKKLHPLFKKRAVSLGRLNGFAEEMLSGQKTIAAYDREDVILSRFDDRNEDAVQSYYEAEYRASTMGPCIRFINDFGLALICVFGSILYMMGEVNLGAVTIAAITLGDISSFVLYSRKFAGPINELANLAGELQSALAAAERIFTLLDEEEEPADRTAAEVLDDVHGEVTLENVDFGYEAEQVVLQHLNLAVKPGTIVAIVGPTGAGKTTIINLLMRFYDPVSGQIRVDGTEVRDAARDSLRRQFTMVLQDTWLFSGTIFENIAYGKDGATREEVIRAAKAAKIHSFIERLPQGYDTVLSDDGVNISKGQKQLITIARAMLADSNMLILDEATSNVDSRTERLIQQAMYQLMEHKTCFVIAHRLSTIRGADTILVVRGGAVVEQGTHEELMRKRGFYHSLYTAQFS